MWWRWILAVVFVADFWIGFITLPFALNLAGFWPAVLALALVWVYLLITGFYYLDATLSLPPGANVKSISLFYNGRRGAWISSFFFIFVNYSYLVSYLYMGGPLLAELAKNFGYPLSVTSGYLIVTAIVGITVFLGTKWALTINFFLSILMGAFFYKVILIAGYHGLELSRLNHTTWTFLFSVIPALISTLYYQTAIPTIATLLKHNRQSLRSAIIVGLTLPCLLFVVWLGINMSSASALNSKSLGTLNPSTLDYTTLINIPVFGQWLPALFCVTIITTILGVGIILADFFADLFSFSLKKWDYKRALICLLICIPPLIFAITPLHNFFSATLILSDMGGIYLCALMPIWWVWSMRASRTHASGGIIPQGNTLLVILTAASFFFLYLVVLKTIYEATF